MLEATWNDEMASKSSSNMGMWILLEWHVPIEKKITINIILISEYECDVEQHEMILWISIV